MIKIKILAYLAALIAGLAFMPASVAQASDTGIEVRVVSAETRRALDDVEIVVTARDGDVVSASTDTDGTARFVSLEPGLYALSATGDGLVEAAVLAAAVGGFEEDEIGLLEPDGGARDGADPLRARQADLQRLMTDSAPVRWWSPN